MALYGPLFPLRPLFSLWHALSTVLRPLYGPLSSLWSVVGIDTFKCNGALLSSVSSSINSSFRYFQRFYIFKMCRFDKCMILKVTEQLFHRYFISSEFLKNVSSPKALILRHVHVQVHVLMYTYVHVYVPVHVLMYTYLYMY